MSLETAHTDDLIQRYQQLTEKYVELSLELSSKLEKFGKHRKELQLLTVELGKRGVVPNSDRLENRIKEELDRINNDQIEKNDTR